MSIVRIFSIVVLLAGVALAGEQPPKLDHVVLGYSASWRDSRSPVSTYNFDGLTYLARSFLHPNADGSIEVSPGYFDPQLERLAHQHGVKLLMSMGGEADKADNWVSVATHPDFLQKHLALLAKHMSDNHYDGVDVDWEPAPTTPAESSAYSTYLKALRAKFPDAVITTALPASDYWIGNVHWPDVLASVNYINVMTYDYAGGWGGVAAHGSNLFPPGDYTPTPGYSASEGLQNLLQKHHLPPQKLLMGLTFWGYRFRADKIGDKFPASTPGYADGLSYDEIMALQGTGNYLSLWDPQAQMPYLQRLGGGSVICYENPESIRRKCEYAAANHCAGVMIWHVGADELGLQAPLMDAVVQSNGAHAATLGSEAVAAQIAGMHGSKSGGASAETLAEISARWARAQDKSWVAAKPLKK